MEWWSETLQVWSGGWWSNNNGEQRACITCTDLFPKVIVCTKWELRNFQEVSRVLHLAGTSWAKILANSKYELRSILVADGCTILSPNLEIKSKYFRRTMFLAYSAVLSAYFHTYVALQILLVSQITVSPAQVSTIPIVDYISIQAF